MTIKSEKPQGTGHIQTKVWTLLVVCLISKCKCVTNISANMNER